MSAPTKFGSIVEEEAGPVFPLPVELFGKIQPQLDHRWLVKDLLKASASCVIFGSPGVGKSFLAIDLALHISAGRDWFGRTVAQGGVVYIAAEGQTGLRNRVVAWKKANDIEGEIPFALIPVAVNLLDPDADLGKLHRILSLLEKQWGKIALLVIDTLAATFGGGDENGRDMSAYISNVAGLCMPIECASAVVTHVPLADGVRPRPRGHGSLLGSADTAIHVTGNGTKTIRKISVIKQKDDPPGDDIYFVLKSVDIGRDENREIVTSCILSAGEEIVPTKKGGHRLSDRERIALSELRRLVSSQGQPPPAAIPASELDRDRVRTVCDGLVWKKAVIIQFTNTAIKPDTARTAFHRVRASLVRAELVGFSDEWVWLL